MDLPAVKPDGPNVARSDVVSKVLAVRIEIQARRGGARVPIGDDDAP
jgi:hypothetical protein